MKIKNKSSFKDPVADHAWFEKWALEIQTQNKRTYQRLPVQTSLGLTHIWGLNTDQDGLETLVIFPGARTSPLFWDLDRGLDNLGQNLRIFLVETNGLPNLSDGDTPDIKTLEYGEWANEIFQKLNLSSAFIAGASFGGLICMKFAIVNPEKIKAAFLLNPGCLQPFSMAPRNLYYNLLPIISPSPKNVRKFLDQAIFCKPQHTLSPAAEKLLVDYEVFALTRYKDKTAKPYYMNQQLTQVKVPTYLLEGDRDLLFPYQKSIQNAKEKISALQEVKVFSNVGHGIETYGPALEYVGKVIAGERSDI
ncbi:MAG: alpha/beta hydrolase [Bacteroidia bacterium]|nr:alpha/beta hydrolase [Bacteroidia bacterium]